MANGYKNTMVCGECKATIHASTNLTDNLRSWYRKEALAEVQAILVRPELWEERVRQALAFVTEELTRPEQ